MPESTPISANMMSLARGAILRHASAQFKRTEPNTHPTMADLVQNGRLNVDNLVNFIVYDSTDAPSGATQAIIVNDPQRVPFVTQAFTDITVGEFLRRHQCLQSAVAASHGQELGAIGNANSNARTRCATGMAALKYNYCYAHSQIDNGNCSNCQHDGTLGCSVQYRVTNVGLGPVQAVAVPLPQVDVRGLVNSVSTPSELINAINNTAITNAQREDAIRMAMEDWLIQYMYSANRVRDALGQLGGALQLPRSFRQALELPMLLRNQTDQLAFGARLDYYAINPVPLPDIQHHVDGTAVFSLASDDQAGAGGQALLPTDDQQPRHTAVDGVNTTLEASVSPKIPVAASSASSLARHEILVEINLTSESGPRSGPYPPGIVNFGRVVTAHASVTAVHPELAQPGTLVITNTATPLKHDTPTQLTIVTANRCAPVPTGISLDQLLAEFPSALEGDTEQKSRASWELKNMCTRALACLALQPLRFGNEKWNPATRSSDGCLLAHKSGFHPYADYVSINVPYEKRKRSPKDVHREKRKPQLAHRVVVRAFKSDAEIDNMFKDSYEVSHLCGNGNCFEAAHLTVEDRALNLARKTCQDLFIKSSVILGDRQKLSVQKPYKCPHSPPCLRRTVELVMTKGC